MAKGLAIEDKGPAPPPGAAVVWSADRPIPAGALVEVDGGPSARARAGPRAGAAGGDAAAPPAAAPVSLSALSPMPPDVACAIVALVCRDLASGALAVPPSAEGAFLLADGRVGSFEPDPGRADPGPLAPLGRLALTLLLGRERAAELAGPLAAAPDRPLAEVLAARDDVRDLVGLGGAVSRLLHGAAFFLRAREGPERLGPLLAAWGADPAAEARLQRFVRGALEDAAAAAAVLHRPPPAPWRGPGEVAPLSAGPATGAAPPPQRDVPPAVYAAPKPLADLLAETGIDNAAALHALACADLPGLGDAPASEAASAAAIEAGLISVGLLPGREVGPPPAPAAPAASAAPSASAASAAPSPSAAPSASAARAAATAPRPADGEPGAKTIAAPPPGASETGTLAAHTPGTTGETVAVGDREADLAEERAVAAARRLLAEARKQQFEDRFALGGQVGKGGMGEVYAARDLRLNRQVAVKVLSGALADRSRILNRFCREAQITAQLAHPNVVPVYTLEATSEGHPAFAMKLIRGITFRDLRDEVRAARGTPRYRHDQHGLAARLEPCVRVCEAVAYAHSRGVIHRDLKPANLMLGAFGEVYVMDWGVARVLGDAESDPAITEIRVDTPFKDFALAETQVGEVVGTPMYMSPEQARGLSAELTPASDLYSLGLILFEMATLAAPRGGASVEAVVRAALEGGHAPWPADCDVPAPLRAIIDRATARAPEARYASVAALADDLRRFLHGEEVSAYPDTPLRRVFRWIAAHPGRVLLTVVAVLLAASAVTTVSLMRGLEAERAAARRTERVASLVSRTAAHARGIDIRLQRIRELLAGLAETTKALLRHAEPREARRLVPLDLAEDRGPPDTVWIERYQQQTSFLRPVWVAAPDADPARVAADLARLDDLDVVFRRMFLTSESEEAAALPEPAATALLRRGVPLQYAYVSFESGLIVNYPGGDVFAAGYDPRRRPWYVAARDRLGPFTGDLYPDQGGSGYLLPCNAALRDDDGRLLGVVGADMSMDRIIAEMEVPGLAGLESAYLIERSGAVLVDSRDRGFRSGIGLHGDAAKARARFPVEEVIRRLASADEDPAGFVSAGSHLWVYARLEAVPWALVVRLDARRALAP